MVEFIGNTTQIGTHDSSSGTGKLRSEWVQGVADKMIELREYVHNINKQPKLAYRNGIYQGLQLDTVYTRKHPGWEFGYRIEDLRNGFLNRKVFLKCEQALRTVPKKESSPVFETALHVFMDIGNEVPKITVIADECMLIEQNFTIMFQAQKNPNILGFKGHV